MKVQTTMLLLFLNVALTVFSACDTSVNAPRTVTDSYGHIRVSWSPDGSTIAFSSVDQNAAGIYMVGSLGGNLRKVFDGEAIGLSWSPDGRWLACSRSGTLYRMKPNGDYPAWSPDGSRVAYTRTQAGAGGLWVMNADGRNKRRLTTP